MQQRPNCCPAASKLVDGGSAAKFLANQTLGFGGFAQLATTHQIYNVMTVASQDLTRLTMNPPRKLVLQVIANLKSSINTQTPEQIVPS